MAEKKIRNDASSSSGNYRGENVLVDDGRHRSSFGYCRSGGHRNISRGQTAHSLTVDHYQALLDGGWRTSDCFLYKPEMETTQVIFHLSKSNIECLNGCKGPEHEDDDWTC
ncbi:arginyl-tRNA--protein transferase 2-like isoform X2 [Actinidia eriantha]|uniref:arginyl-tRNA--protein transferase 2-like isoform X2 n=1 Tax=Actinidia eriantha TaxID=165200 RepID=UPI00258AA186|nr:arginyl-tRNA--protein transferase 2-like isoform X2 [Actinidia eriantha]